MSNINLLPWREALRKIRNNVFYASVGFVVFASIVLIVLTHLILQSMINTENKNILVLQNETKAISEKIKEIKTLQQDKQDLIHRMEVVQLLQASRTMAVHLIDILPEAIPDGIFLTDIERKSDEIIVSGNAQTNASVSLFLENLQAKKWEDFIANVELEEIKSNKTNGLDFKVKFHLLKPV